ncbi:MAG: lyase family protein [archaeon]
MDVYDFINPTDFRYYAQSEDHRKALGPYLSENGMVRYMARVEAALTQALAKAGVCSKKAADEVTAAAEKVTAEEVYKEEARIRHNVRALANTIRDKVSDSAKPYVHLTATSHDIICTADSARYRDVTHDVLLPALKDLERVLIVIARREKSTVQIGRTHGQHAEPLTFGFAMAEYVSRLGTRIQAIGHAADNLRGKLAGAVGAYNQGALFLDDPQEVEKDFLSRLGLRPATHATQIVEPEFMADYMHAVITAFGVLASLSDDMRHLQRSEIAEVGEAFAKNQVGSSTMPHKRNPINFENVKSMWKAFMPRMITSYLDQPSEHQRDLTNSASSRYHAETVAALYLSTRRLEKSMAKLKVDAEGIKRNFAMNSRLIPAEPLYLILAKLGHPDAHEASRKITLEVEKNGSTVWDESSKDKELMPYIDRMNPEQKNLIQDPTSYTGLSEKKAEAVCKHWETALKL